MRSARDVARPVVHPGCVGGAGIPQYRLRAIEGGLLREVRADLARRYFYFLGIDEWVADWCRANLELATRIGLPDGTRTRPRHRT